MSKNKELQEREEKETQADRMKWIRDAASPVLVQLGNAVDILNLFLGEHACCKLTQTRAVIQGHIAHIITLSWEWLIPCRH
eukprot:6255766-Amphidinium_carterae.1